MRSWFPLLTTLMATVVIVTACASKKPVAVMSNISAPDHTVVGNGVNGSGSKTTDGATTKAIANVILAKSDIPGHPGQVLELVDVNGRYVYDPNPGPLYGGSWTGTFQLRVVTSSGKVLSKLTYPVPQAVFVRKFQFHFADYNGDGYPDFTLGQHAGSNGNWYQIFSLLPTGISVLHSDPAELFVSNFSYSPVFQKVKPDGFKVKYYDNSKGEWFQATYIWNSKQFQQRSLEVVPAKG